MEKLIKAARNGRWGHRDATLILTAYRHGLRAIEICNLEWSQVEFGRNATLQVRRAKNGKPSTHPLRGDEIRALRELRRQFPEIGFVFATERGGPFTADAINRLIKRIGERAGLPFPVHAHMLRKLDAPKAALRSIRNSSSSGRRRVDRTRSGSTAATAAPRIRIAIREADEQSSSLYEAKNR